MTIRKVKSEDIDELKIVIDSSELFPSELLDEMISDYLHNDDSPDIWLTKEVDSIPVAIVYCAPEKLTLGTYNLYLIAVRQDHQGKGMGAEMMNYIESLLQESGHRILLVETSGLPEYALTRNFYEKLGYTKEATIRDFYQEGEDKVVFWKKLS